MIGKVVRGTDAGGLLRYLYGRGRANEHIDPRLVAGFGDPAELEVGHHPDGRHDLRRLAGLLAQPLAVPRRPYYDKPVWHCSVRVAPSDRLLSDAEWAEIATEIMETTGLATEDDYLGVRWLAVRHAPDHIHIVATLTRQDGGRPDVWNDFYKVRAACRSAERRLGLERTAPADRTAARRPSCAEREKAARRGWAESARDTLRREVSAAAAAASTEQEFFARLGEAGVLVRQRASTRTPGEVTGCAVALPDDLTSSGGVVWYGGGKLAADLTLPKLRHRWAPSSAPTRTPASDRITAADRHAVYVHAVRQARAASDHIRRCAVSDPARGADAAWAAADALHVAARVLRNPELRRAADAYDRAARAPYGRIPCRTAAGNRLRHAARALAVVGGRPGSTAAHLLVSLADLTAVVAELRIVQSHWAQAAAARCAAKQLHARPAPGERRLGHTRRGGRLTRPELTSRPRSSYLTSQPETRHPPRGAVRLNHPGVGPPQPVRDLRRAKRGPIPEGVREVRSVLPRLGMSW